jgi:hypothetical protein
MMFEVRSEIHACKGIRSGNLKQARAYPFRRVAGTLYGSDTFNMNGKEISGVYEYRAQWLDMLCARFGGVERFAELVGKNSKFFSAIRGRKKPMGSRVARDIEQALMAKHPSEDLAGLLDTDPAVYAGAKAAAPPRDMPKLLAPPPKAGQAGQDAAALDTLYSVVGAIATAISAHSPDVGDSIATALRQVPASASHGAAKALLRAVEQAALRARANRKPRSGAAPEA